MLIVIPPPCKLTPLLFRLSFFLSDSVFVFFLEGGRDDGVRERAAREPIEPARAGDRVLSKSSRSDRSESSEADSENGK